MFSSSTSMVLTLLVCITQVCGFVVSAPVAPAPPPASQPSAIVVDLPAQLTALQQQLHQVQQQLTLASNPQEQTEEDPVDGLFNKPKQFNRRQISFQPMRRMVSWQPMKKAAAPAVPNYSREQVMKAIEDQLTETLHAGEQLGVSANDILTHLRLRNMMLYQQFA